MPTATTVQLRAVGLALGDVHWKTDDGEHIGVYEEATNDGPRIRAFLERSDIDVAAPWCAAAVYFWCSDACEMLDWPNPLEEVEHKALVQSYVDWAEDAGRVIGRADRIVGDLACFSFGGERYDHIGLVQSVEPLQTVEGNTFLADGDDDAPGQRGEREGYEVEVRERRTQYRKPTLFIRWATAA